MTKTEEQITALYIDLFCGAGGTSSGVEYATVDGRKCAEVIACVNHDANAIKSHAANHPKTMHFTEDIRTLDLTQLVLHTMAKRNEHPHARLVLWASLECTNFSKAKGGQPRDADSRTLAEHLFRYIEALQPDYVEIENVEEFMCWGELDEHGKPVSKRRGTSYIQWVRHVMDYGYDYDWRLLNAADFGAYTSRKRFFGLFARKGLPIAFPEQTYAKTTVPLASGKDDEEGAYHPNPDWSELFPGFYKPWKPVREVLDLDDDGESIFVRRKPLCEKTLERIYAGLVKFVAGGKKRHEAWILKFNSMNQQNHHNAPSIDEPMPTVPTKDRFALVTSQFLDNQYGKSKPTSIEAPAPTLLNNPKQKIVSAQYLMNPYSFKSDGGSIDKPCFTLIARMDKMPPYLVSTEQGVGIAIYEDDSPMTRKVKEFMAMYGIIDIKMRMLKIVELKRIMGFPTDYVLIGTQSEQKKFIGNAVEVNMSRVLCEALCRKLMDKTA